MDCHSGSARPAWEGQEEHSRVTSVQQAHLSTDTQGRLFSSGKLPTPRPPQNNLAPEGTCRIVGSQRPSGPLSPHTLTAAGLSPQTGPPLSDWSLPKQGLCLPPQTGAFHRAEVVSRIRLGAPGVRRWYLSSQTTSSSERLPSGACSLQNLGGRGVPGERVGFTAYVRGMFCGRDQSLSPRSVAASATGW